jgi:hypothetical protein
MALTYAYWKPNVQQSGMSYARVVASIDRTESKGASCVLTVHIGVC